MEQILVDTDSDVDIDIDENSEDTEDCIDDGEDYFQERENSILSSGRKTHIAQLLMKKNKKFVARFIKEEVMKMDSSYLQEPYPDMVITELLNILLNPLSDISSINNIMWIKWLIAGGSTPKEFFKEVEQFDNPTTCSLVWTANFMAYRCRTCGISPCMSLCLECFNKGNHQGHDYNMFKSQAGGACDCGNRAVMDEAGFCSRHKGSSRNAVTEPPSDLLLLAKIIMPRLLLRFILHCRANGVPSDGEELNTHDPVADFENFVAFLQDLCRLGAAMRNVMTEAFCNPQIYENYTEIRRGMCFYDEMVRCKALYSEALESIPFGEIPPGYEDISTLHGPLVHNTFLEEILFWTLKFEFPQKLVCLLLNMRPDPVYEDAFARAFVQHYSRISVMLLKAEESDPLSHRVVHVSVQLFSDQNLAYKMTDSYHLLHVMVLSVKKIMKKISVPSTLHDLAENTHKVVNCSHDLMKNHSYWPLVSDLNNILSHEPIARKFMSDSRLLQEWFSFLSYFQGMNNNLRELNQHVEYEPQSYYAAFTAELEVSASPLWAMLSHMKDESTQIYTLTVLNHCVSELRNWFKEIGFFRQDRFHHHEATFHLPLHRNFALLLCHAVRKQGVSLSDVLPNTELLTLMLVHPLRAQVAFHEIICNLWVRNGLQIKGQAMTYIQCHFCNSMFDPDLYLLQVGAGVLPKDSFLLSIIERFHVLKYLSFSKQPLDAEPDGANRFKMLESCLVFLSILVTNRHNLGLNEEEVTEKEVIALTCTYDKTHSRLMEYVPEKCVTNPSVDFDGIVKKYTKYIEPECQRSGTMREGLYVPRDFVWEEHFDPVMTMTRCLHKKEYQSSLNRFKQYCRKSEKVSARKASRLWPPYRLPPPVNASYQDPRRILACRTFHGILFTLLYKSLYDPTYTENMLSLTIYLLELVIDFQIQNKDDGGSELTSPDMGTHEKMEFFYDGLFYLWYSTDNIFKNCTTMINRILLNSFTKFQSSGNAGSSSPDVEMEEIEVTEETSQIGLEPQNIGNGVRAIAAGTELVPYQESDSALVLSNVPMELDSTTNSSEGNILVPYQEGASALPTNVVDSSEVSQRVASSLSSSRPIFHTRRVTALPAASGSDGCANNSLVPSNQESHIKALVDSSQNNSSSQALDIKDSSTAPFGQRGNKGRQYLNVHESLITLLLKLHSKLSDRGKPYRPQFNIQMEDSRIGDGTFFIAKVLSKLGQNDEKAKEHILESLSRLFSAFEEEPCSSSDEDASSKMKEERKKKAKERQKRVMGIFNRRQQKFWARNMPSMVGKEEVSKSMEEEQYGHEKEYDCVICNQSIPSTYKRPFGLVVYMEPTSVHGLRTTSSSGFDIPVNDRTRSRIRHQRYTLAKHMRNRAEILNQYFDTDSWLLSVDLGWEGGVHVQTCGHYLHLDCHKSYILSLQSQPVSVENGANYARGEYFCPFCRHLSNSVLPIFDDSPCDTGLKTQPGTSGDFVSEIDKDLRHITVQVYSRVLTTSIYATMEDLTKRTPPKYRTLAMNPDITLPSTFVFLSSIFRTNLEIELVQRGGSLVSQQDDPNIVKRSSLIPLIHILSYHAKVLTSNNEDRLRSNQRETECIRLVWASLSQRFPADLEGNAVSSNDRDVPILFKDPVSVLLHMVLMLPFSSVKRYYKYIVLNVYRLVVARAAVSALRSLTEEKISLAIVNGPLAPLLSMAYSNLRDSPFLRCELPMPLFIEEMSISTDFTCEVREACLDFLRVASILKSHILDERLPYIADPLAECGTLEQYLDVWNTCSVVNTAVMGRMCGTLIADNVLYSNSSSASPAGTPVETQVGELSGAIKVWCSQIASFALKAPMIAGSLLTNVRFYKPCLLILPTTFDEIFQFYHQRKCSSCNNVPKDPGVCLVCGTLVCMRQGCCSQDNVLESVQHARDCGAGTGIFLAVLQAAVIVIKQRRVCLWGCVHLDSYGEEDKDLKRGKPLFLSKGRYQLLQDQLIHHSFIHTPHKWVWHNNLI